MIVLAESNFVLEAAFQQEECADVEKIVARAEAQLIELVIPACALTEPYETLIRRRKQRNLTLESLRNELNQIGRSQEFADITQTSKAVTEALAKSGATEAKGLEDTIARLLACASVTPLTKDVVALAQALQLALGLGPQDAIVLASVETHLTSLTAEPGKLFINKNHRDFLTEGIERRLQERGCRLIPSFSNARQFIEHTIAAG
jgi:predicted nucleic acid-binding protein